MSEKQIMNRYFIMNYKKELFHRASAQHVCNQDLISMEYIINAMKSNINIDTEDLLMEIFDDLPTINLDNASETMNQLIVEYIDFVNNLGIEPLNNISDFFILLYQILKVFKEEMLFKLQNFDEIIEYYLNSTNLKERTTHITHIIYIWTVYGDSLKYIDLPYNSLFDYKDTEEILKFINFLIISKNLPIMDYFEVIYENFFLFACHEEMYTLFLHLDDNSFYLFFNTTLKQCSCFSSYFESLILSNIEFEEQIKSVLNKILDIFGEKEFNLLNDYN